MTRVLRSLLLPAMLVAMLGLPAGADEHPPCRDAETGELVLTEQQVWLHQAETKAGNLAALDLTQYPTWSEEAPTASVTDGAGGGYYAGFLHSQAAAAPDDLAGLTVIGESAGCLDTMLVELYAFLPTNRASINTPGEEMPLTANIKLTVDGRELLWPAQLDLNTDANPHGDATYRLRFAITNLHASLTRNGFDPEGTRELRLNINPQFVNTDHTLFVYDTVEVPATIRFNGEVDDDHPRARAT